MSTKATVRLLTSPRAAGPLVALALALFFWGASYVHTSSWAAVVGSSKHRVAAVQSWRGRLALVYIYDGRGYILDVDPTGRQLGSWSAYLDQHVYQSVASFAPGDGKVMAYWLSEAPDRPVWVSSVTFTGAANRDYMLFGNIRSPGYRFLGFVIQGGGPFPPNLVDYLVQVPWWSIALLLAGLTVRGIRRSLKKFATEDAAAGLCPTCSYDLRAHLAAPSIQNQKPAASTPKNPPTPLAASPHRPIAASDPLPPLPARCPECGTPISPLPPSAQSLTR
jgi:hypothetical protein